MTRKRFGVGRTGGTKSSQEIDGTAKAIMGVILLLCFFYLVYASLKYSERFLSGAEVEHFNYGSEGSGLIDDMSKCSVRVFIGREGSERWLDIKSVVESTGFGNISIAYIVSPQDVKDSIYYVPSSVVSINKLISATKTISERAELPEPVRLDAQIIIGKDIPTIYRNALSNEEFDLSGISFEILNGSGIEGAASQVADLLRSHGGRINDIRNADSFNYDKTFIRTGMGQKSHIIPVLDFFGMGDGRLDESLDQIIIVLGE